MTTMLGGRPSPAERFDASNDVRMTAVARRMEIPSRRRKKSAEKFPFDFDCRLMATSKQRAGDRFLSCDGSSSPLYLPTDRPAGSHPWDHSSRRRVHERVRLE